MKRSNHRNAPKRMSWMLSVLLGAVAFVCPAPQASGQSAYQPTSSGMLKFESSGAAKLEEKVRSACQGVVVSIYVKSGDVVKKGQLLGNVDLDSTKLQLELAKHAYLAKSNVESAKNQADAWKINREETEQAVRRRKVEETRLDWALAMEKMYRANYEAQLDAETTQQIQYQYWKDQYEKRFFRSPADGVVTEVLAEIGKPVGIASHLFTVSNDGTYALPVEVPAELAENAIGGKMLPVRSADGKSVSHAKVDRVTDDPRETGRKIVRLLVKAADFPASVRPKLSGMKFDVLLPQASRGEIQ